jgi:hypothetical protein
MGVVFDFRIGSHLESLENGGLGRSLGNGWIIFLLDHTAAHFQSAAEQFVPTGLKTDRNSLVGKDLNW